MVALFFLFISCLYMTILSESESSAVDAFYNDIESGFLIDQSETDTIYKNGGNPTYGEITTQAINELIKEIKPTSKDVFYDLGSGIGKMAIHFYLNTPVAESVGVELGHSRHTKALAARKKLKKAGKLVVGRKLTFRNHDISKTPLSDGTIIYMCSTCFSDDLLKKITNKIAAIKHPVKVITLKQLPEHTQFSLIKEFSLPMTWSSNVPVYLYQKK